MDSFNDFENAVAKSTELLVNAMRKEFNAKSPLYREYWNGRRKQWKDLREHFIEAARSKGIYLV